MGTGHLALLRITLAPNKVARTVRLLGMRSRLKSLPRAAAICFGYRQFSIVAKSKCDRWLEFKVDAFTSLDHVMSVLSGRTNAIRSCKNYQCQTVYRWNTPFFVLIGAIPAIQSMQSMSTHKLSRVYHDTIELLSSIDGALNLKYTKTTPKSGDVYILQRNVQFSGGNTQFLSSQNKYFSFLSLLRIFRVLEHKLIEFMSFLE